MNKIFGENGSIYRGINKLVDLIMLNVLFILSCVPIITVGVAYVSMYQITLKMIKNEESYIVRSYVKGIKENLKKATICWGVIVVILMVLGVDFFITFSLDNPIRKILLVLLLSVLLITIMVSSYVFPLMAMFENSLKNTVKNAVIISMSKIVYTVVIVSVNILPVGLIFCMENIEIDIVKFYLLIGFSLSAYINSFFLQSVFKKVFRIQE